MKLVVPMEISSGEHRVGLTPDSILSLKKMGFDVFVESNAGSASSFTDIDYKKSGARISTKVSELYKNADLIVKVQRPQNLKNLNEFKYLKKCSVLTLLYEQKFKAEFNSLKKLNINVFALEKCQEFLEPKAWMFFPHKVTWQVIKPLLMLRVCLIKLFL